MFLLKVIISSSVLVFVLTSYKHSYTQFRAVFGEYIGKHTSLYPLYIPISYPETVYSFKVPNDCNFIVIKSFCKNDVIFLVL